MSYTDIQKMVLTYLGRSSNWNWGQDIVPTAVESMTLPNQVGKPLYAYEFRHWISSESSKDTYISISNIGELPLWFQDITFYQYSDDTPLGDKGDAFLYEWGSYYQSGASDRTYNPQNEEDGSYSPYPIDKHEQKKFALMPSHTLCFKIQLDHPTVDTSLRASIRIPVDNLPTKIHFI